MAEATPMGEAPRAGGGGTKKGKLKEDEAPWNAEGPGGRGADAWRCWGLAWHRGET